MRHGTGLVLNRRPSVPPLLHDLTLQIWFGNPCTLSVSDLLAVFTKIHIIHDNSSDCLTWDWTTPTFEPLSNLLALCQEHWADPPCDLALSGNEWEFSFPTKTNLRDASGKLPAKTSSSLCTTLLLVLLLLGLARRSSCNASNNSSLVPFLRTTLEVLGGMLLPP